MTGDSGPYGPYRHSSGTDGKTDSYKQGNNGVTIEDPTVDNITSFDPSPGQGPSPDNIFQQQKPSMLNQDSMRPSPTPSAQPTPSPVNNNNTHTLNFQHSPRQPEVCPTSTNQYKTFSQETAGTGGFFGVRQNVQIHQNSHQMLQNSGQINLKSQQLQPKSQLGNNLLGMDLDHRLVVKARRKTEEKIEEMDKSM